MEGSMSSAADFNTVNAPSVPFVVPFFYLVGKAYFERHENGQPVPLRLSILDPARNPLTYPDLDVMLVPIDPNDPSIPSSAGFVIQIQSVEFKSFGTHRLITKVGDLEGIEILLRVQEAPH